MPDKIKVVDETQLERDSVCSTCGKTIPKGTIIVTAGNKHYCHAHGYEVIVEERARLYGIEVAVYGEDG